MFQTRYQLPLEMLGRLVLLNFATQLVTDIVAVKFVDRTGYRVPLVLAHVLAAPYPAEPQDPDRWSRRVQVIQEGMTSRVMSDIRACRSQGSLRWIRTRPKGSPWAAA